MIGRSAFFFGILLFCVLAVSCRKADGPDNSADGENPAGRQEDGLFPGTDPVDIHIYESGDDTEQENAQSDGFREGSVDAEEADTDDKAVQADNFTYIQEGNTLKEDKDLKEEDTVTEALYETVKLAQLSQALPAGSRLKDKVSPYPAGTVIDTAGTGGEEISSLFYSEQISDEVKSRIIGKSYGEKCDIPFEELRYIRVLFIGFDKLTHIGELIVSKSIAEDITDIFRELYDNEYPIERMVLVDDYDADDIASMEANNTSAFNYRVIDRSTKLSNHSYGLAIDINPLYNPYVRTFDGEMLVLPENGTEYADRDKECPYYIKEGDDCYLAFTKRGFTWGGDWKSQKDYQHFEKR